MQTFVIKLWTPEGPLQPGASRFHGVVEHVTSGRTLAFSSAEELIDFVSSSLEADRLLEP